MLSPSPLLNIEGLNVAYRVAGQDLPVLREISLEVLPGQTVGLVGESGSGKSTLALTVMRQLAANGVVTGGRVEFDGKGLLELTENEMRVVWGRELAFVPQNPATALNPAMRVGEQLAEALRLYGAGRAAAEARSRELLEQVRLAEPRRVARSYPHQLSGGMQQRVMIALALSGQPRLLVLDEPTTALDVTTEASVLDLLREQVGQRESSVLYVTHNLGVVATLSDRVAVLYAGELAEDAPTEDLFRQPLHPYTRGLLDSVPRLGQRKEQRPLQGIPGQVPRLRDFPNACVFAPRCPLAIELCWKERPLLDAPTPERRVRCHRWPEIMAGEVSAHRGEVKPIQRAKQEVRRVLNVEDLKVDYPLPSPFLQTLVCKSPRAVHAVREVSVGVSSGQTLGVVGESGSGKSSLARSVIGLAERSSGRVELLGIELPARLSRRSREMLSHLQMVFQNPEEALNPYLTVAESLTRPLIRLRGLSTNEARQQVPDLLAAVRLPADYAQRFPGQLSGGEKQRVAIARAFASGPELLLADEPVSALDVSVQANILNLLAELQVERQTAMLLIAHDIAVVGYLADQIVVMYLGEFMQVSPAEAIFDAPYHPYTEALLSSVPPPDPFVEQKKIRLEGELPSAIDLPGGCPFHTRCPRFLGDICAQQTPPWRETGDGKRIFCHIPVEELVQAQEPVLRFDGKRRTQR
ncbi:MAG: ABC transporter ATP-binding protein [Anaerolineales bacterium]